MFDTIKYDRNRILKIINYNNIIITKNNKNICIKVIKKVQDFNFFKLYSNHIKIRYMILQCHQNDDYNT